MLVGVGVEFANHRLCDDLDNLWVRYAGLGPPAAHLQLAHSVNQGEVLRVGLAVLGDREEAVEGVIDEALTGVAAEPLVGGDGVYAQARGELRVLGVLAIVGPAKREGRTVGEIHTGNLQPRSIWNIGVVEGQETYPKAVLQELIHAIEGAAGPPTRNHHPAGPHYEAQLLFAHSCRIEGRAAGLEGAAGTDIDVMPRARSGVVYGQVDPRRLREEALELLRRVALGGDGLAVHNDVPRAHLRTVEVLAGARAAIGQRDRVAKSDG